MPRKKRRRMPPEGEIPEELPEEEASLGEEEIPRAELRVPPAPGEPEDRETQWARIETEVAAIKDGFIWLLAKRYQSSTPCSKTC